MATALQKLAEFTTGPGRRHTAFVSGPPGAGKTRLLAQAVWLALDEGAGLHEVAAYAPSRPLFKRLALAIGERFPEVEEPSQDLLSPELRGLPLDAMAAHTALEGEPAPLKFVIEWVASAWLEVVARTSSIDMASERDAAWLASLKPQAVAGLMVDYQARLERRPLPSHVHLEVLSEFAAAYKRRERLLDYADLLHGDYVVSPQVRLLVLDEVDERDHTIVERFFPNASVIASGLKPRPAEIQIEAE